jgi:hypothetical protein
MLDKDITWLAGAQPSEQEISGDELVMTYIAERKRNPSNGRYDLPIELRFVRLDEKYRLKEGYLGTKLTDMLTEEMLTQIMLSVCKSQKSLVKQQVTIDIRSLDRTLLPAKSKIIHILGPPNPQKGDESHLTYDYQLKNHDAIGRVAVIDIQFDRTAERILRIKMKYLRYNLDADFEKGEAILNVDIFDDRKT